MPRPRKRDKTPLLSSAVAAQKERGIRRLLLHARGKGKTTNSVQTRPLLTSNPNKISVHIQPPVKKSVTPPRALRVNQKDRVRRRRTTLADPPVKVEIETKEVKRKLQRNETDSLSANSDLNLFPPPSVDGTMDPNLESVTGSCSSEEKRVEDALDQAVALRSEVSSEPLGPCTPSVRSQQASSVASQDPIFMPKIIEGSTSDEHSTMGRLLTPSTKESSFVTPSLVSSGQPCRQDPQPQDAVSESELSTICSSQHTKMTKPSVVEVHPPEVNTPTSSITRPVITRNKAPSQVRAMLSRPFGRNSLPPELSRRWVVEVSSAEWDADNREWKYRILIQRRQLVNDRRRKGSKYLPQQSFTAAFTWRTRRDFIWLQSALQQEFCGGLLVPDLATALGRVENLDDEEIPIEADRLRNWLGDILNGVRGQGETLLEQERVDLLKSQSLEAFLYRSSGPSNGDKTPTPQVPAVIDAEQTDLRSSLPSLLFSSIEMCVGPKAMFRSQTGNEEKPVDDDIDDNKIPSLADAYQVSSRVAPHAVLICAQGMFFDEQRLHTTEAYETILTLTQAEKRVGAAWKRYAGSIANLFAFEKDAESIRLGESRSIKENMPFRKISKADVDSQIRKLAQSKADRSLPALAALKPMLSAWSHDLETMRPSLSAFLRKAKKTSDLVEMSSVTRSVFRTVSSFSSARNRVRSSSSASSEVSKSVLSKSEQILSNSLAMFGKSMPLRMSRMAWRYLNTEAGQCALSHSSAKRLRLTVSAVNQSVVEKMRERHAADELKDCELERELVGQILQISSLDQSHKKVMSLVSESNGKWDSNVALAILRAVGMEDANVREEDASRELKVVRKYAIGLRDKLNRCADAVQYLREAIIGVQQHSNSSYRLNIERKALIKQLSQVFSCRCEGKELRECLTDTFIDPSDPSGWSYACSPYDRGGKARGIGDARLGELFSRYADDRDKDIHSFLAASSEMLEGYFSKIEIVESFVYMHCVGLQLEKFFSDRRSNALDLFEKKTDITTAMNLATKKRIPRLVQELRGKLDALGSGVSQTIVKKTKESHLRMKRVQSELNELAMRRLMREKERSTERVIAMIDKWAHEEESLAASELKSLGEAMKALESSVYQRGFDDQISLNPSSTI